MYTLYKPMAPRVGVGARCIVWPAVGEEGAEVGMPSQAGGLTRISGGQYWQLVIESLAQDGIGQGSEEREGQDEVRQQCAEQLAEREPGERVCESHDKPVGSPLCKCCDSVKMQCQCRAR